ncbi:MULTISPECIES: glycine cleavage system protein GcvH [Thioalkalivibrio]|uniref:Glycine cleavage system H protein n=1 Tax=Thioalkalivibrio halophilus TaxID=252474 RepID=A0A1V3A1D2_9GAMM|nr:MULTISPECIES: glycine cleavage system protein GcvH [Thioalkalivibrio]OOC11109.1 glycine cleavage system protein H [Thioalkalivibrio halophilus]PYG02510.1 glycine cleavage system H protein [Thioalkalivibrio sp. ALE21]
MSEAPKDLKYTRSHEWVRTEDDGTVTIGITDHAQELLGDLVFVEAPEAGSSLEAGTACATVESVKAASDIYAPIGGEVTETNAELEDSPEKVNESPFEDGWLFRMKPANAADLDALMDADAYAAHVEAES